MSQARFDIPPFNIAKYRYIPAALVLLVAQLLASPASQAVEVLSTHELVSHCEVLDQKPEGADAQYCIRYIQGFGKINWIEGKDFGPVLPKWWDNKQKIIDHMNNDHQSALNKYRDQILEVKGEVSLFDVSVEGFHLKVDDTIHYISFSRPCLEENSVREEFIWLLRTLE